jgi:long-chain acyl-CoA synthetase
MAGVPTMFSYMLQLEGAEKKYDLSSIKSWPSGSAPFPVEPMNEFLRRFGGVILEGYGLSEASPIVSAHSRTMEKKPGSVGKEIENVETRIVDEDDNEVPTGAVGQLLVRGPNVMKGYFKMPEETARVLRNGWLRTGDMARKDEEGYLYIVERKKDLIIRGGENIYPREVEEVLWQHPKVQEAAIIGVPDPVMGEEVKAFVVLKPGEQATAEEIVNFCRERLAKFKSPKVVSFVDALPRSLIGKVLRRELREKEAC